MMFSQKQKEYLANANHRWNVKQGATRSGVYTRAARYIDQITNRLTTIK